MIGHPCRGIEPVRPLNGDIRRVALLDVQEDRLVQSNNSIKTDHIEIKLAPAEAKILKENGSVKGLFISKLRPKDTSEPVFATFHTTEGRENGQVPGADDLFAFTKIRTLYVDIIGLVLYKERSGEILATTVPGPDVANAAAGIEFVRIAPGSFQMGCSTGDSECNSDESPTHRVTISKGFELGKYEVTQAQWQAVMGTNPSKFKGASLPVEGVWGQDVGDFLTRLNARNGGYRYRLPTEAEWEYAARAGTTGAHTGSVDAVAWYRGNSGGQTHPVGQKQANAWGLYDMEGNVFEWVDGWWTPRYSSEAQTDPKGLAASESNRIFRGGSWEYSARDARVSDRGTRVGDYFYDRNLGFRLVREAIR